MEISMKEVREEIDLIDKELVLLLARRQKCVEMAAAVKNDKDLIIDKERIEEVIAKVTQFWRYMRFTQRYFRAFMEKINRFKYRT